MADEDPPYPVGYGRPPKGTQFPPRTSGNPKGRPRGSRKSLPHEFVLGRELTVIENGARKKVQADRAFIDHLVNQALAKEGRLRTLAMDVLEQPQARPDNSKPRLIIYKTYPEPGEIDKSMRQIGMAALLDPYRANAKLVIEPWLVQSALERLGDSRFTIAEQKTVVSATRKPHTVQWPDWWEAKPD
jgi:hypothetical protein